MKKMPDLKHKTGRLLGIYAVLIIALIFIFQAVLLQPMYTRSKIRSVNTVTEQIAEALDTDTYLDSVYRLSRENDACIRIVADTYEVTDQAVGCVLNRMSPWEIQEQIGLAEENGGSWLSILEDKHGAEGLQSIVSTRVQEDGTVIMVSTNLTALNATVRTLRVQMLFIAGILVIATLLLVLVLNRWIGDPLVKITREAESLPEGSYHTDESTNVFKEAVELNRTLEQAAADIRKADRAKRDLLANVSHDLRTPLTMIGGYGEMMRDIPGEKTDENLQVIIDESRRLNSLVNDLLDLSRLQDERISLQYSVFSMDELVRRELRKYDVFKVQDGYEFVCSAEEHLYVRADEQRIAQVVNNFLSNAVNYSAEDRRIGVRCFRQDNQVITEVEDHGEGIPEAQLKDVWERYYKVDRTHVRPVSGSGLGLAIVKEILELHGAKYGVRSKEGEGSTFWFALPAGEENEDTGHRI